MIHRKGRSLRKLVTVTALSLGSGSLLMLHAPATAAVGDSYSPAVETRNCTSVPASDFGTIAGAGATFANNVHNDPVNGWIARFNAGCTNAAGKVSYASTGSGAGQRATRDRSHAWGGSDEPLDTALQHCYEANGSLPAGASATSVECDPGTPKPYGGPGKLGHFPLAVGAITIYYNAPACFGTGTQLTLTSSQIDRIFWNEMTWGDISNETGIGFCTNSDTITRAVRLDSSGTTYAFKEYESKRQPRWRNVGPGANGTDYLANDKNTDWPSVGINLVRGNGNSGVAAAVAANSGAIGYVELSAARKNYTANGGPASSLRWAKVANVAGQSFDPSRNATFAPSTTAQGAACQEPATVAVHPTSPWSPGWDRVTISDGPAGYPICSFTYALVYKPLNLAHNGAGLGAANPNPNRIEDKKDARTLAAYLSFGLNNEPGGGQTFLAANDYGPLGNQTQAVARTGLATLTYEPLP